MINSCYNRVLTQNDSKEPFINVSEHKYIRYTDRWTIEQFFRDCKTYLGLDGYQVRSEKSINRYLVIMLVNYTYCKMYSKDFFNFNAGYKAAKKDL